MAMELGEMARDGRANQPPAFSADPALRAIVAPFVGHRMFERPQRFSEEGALAKRMVHYAPGTLKTYRRRPAQARGLTAALGAAFVPLLPEMGLANARDELWNGERGEPPGETNREDGGNYYRAKQAIRMITRRRSRLRCR
jgi:hypothetical protein